MSAQFGELADFIDEQVGTIMASWAEAVGRTGEIQTADNLTYRQLVDHLPFLCHDLAERLRHHGENTAREEQHAQKHGRYRWEQGYRVDELIREAGILREILTTDCVDRFAEGRAEWTPAMREQARSHIHCFLDDMLAESAHQFSEAKEKTIEAAQQNQRAMLQSSLDSIIVMGQEGHVREWNAAAEQLFGYQREDAIGRELAQLIIPELLREKHRRGLARYLQTGEGPLLGRRIEVPAVRADGSHLLVELAITPYVAEEKSLFTAYLRDVTGQRAQDEASRRLGAIVESSEDAIVSKDLNSTITSWNRGAEKLFGYTAAEAIGQSVLLVIPPERHSEETDIISRIRRGERIANYETVRVRKDGSRVDVSVSISPVKDNGGNIIGAAKIARDITQRVQAESRREAQYAVATLTAGEQSLEETGPEILRSIAGTGRWSLGALWTLQKDGELICRATWRASDERAQFERQMKVTSLAKGQALPGKAAGSAKPVWLGGADEGFSTEAKAAGFHGAFAFPLRGAHGVNGAIELLSTEAVVPDDDLVQLAGALGIHVGLYVERKQTEQELQQQKEAAEEASRAKDRFLAALSHELRTPLNPVLMWACAALEDENVDAEMREGLRMVRRNIELEARLIDDLLDLTRITQGKLRLKMQLCRADTLLRHALEIVRSQVEAKELTVTVDLRASNHQIMADATRVQQIFWNLLRNAEKFTPRHGRIDVCSYDAGPGVLALTIKDSGQGIAPALMPKLFVAFEQGESSGEGLGLGLAICRAIVRMHGGKISAASDGPGTGATFTVELNTVPEMKAPPEPAPRKLERRAVTRS